MGPWTGDSVSYRLWGGGSDGLRLEQIFDEFHAPRREGFPK
jgi:hypothetical protein